MRYEAARQVTTPNARPRPIDLTAGWPARMKLPNTKIMIIAAAVTTWAPAANPDSTEPGYSSPAIGTPGIPLRMQSTLLTHAGSASMRRNDPATRG